MSKEPTMARRARKLRASRDGWKERAIEKQEEIQRLRVTVRDLTASRDNWKELAKELQQQLQSSQQANFAEVPENSPWLFFGG